MDQVELHVCFHCGGELVYPLDWSEEGRSWRITLRCPECESEREGVFTAREVERFDDELDRGSHALRSDLDRMTRVNMSEEIERFEEALDAGWITPEDF